MFWGSFLLQTLSNSSYLVCQVGGDTESHYPSLNPQHLFHFGTPTPAACSSLDTAINIMWDAGHSSVMLYFLFVPTFLGDYFHQTEHGIACSIIFKLGCPDEDLYPTSVWLLQHIKLYACMIESSPEYSICMELYCHHFT